MSHLPAVLYVEDDRQSRKLMLMLLSDRMKLPNVTILEDSENFLAHIDALDPKPDVIFLDIHMEPLSGFEMLQILRAQAWAKDTPIIALTASVMNEEVQRLRTAPPLESGIGSHSPLDPAPGGRKLRRRCLPGDAPGLQRQGHR